MAKKRIIVIDDEPNIIHLIKKVFAQNDDVEVHDAENGLRGLQLLEDLGYTADVIILDYHMPEMTGIAMLRELRRKKPDFPVPVIMSTTQFEEKTDEAKKLGIVVWILKPIKEEKIRDLVPQVFRYYPVRSQA